MTHYERAIAVNQYSPMCYLYFGSTLLSMNRPEDSLAACSKAESLDPRSKLIMYQKSHALLRLNRDEEALTLLRKLA